MTEEQRPARERAYQPWTDQEYGVLERMYKSKEWSLGRIALSLSRYPSEVELALERLRIYNEKIAKRNEAVEHRQAIKKVFESWETKQANEAIRNFPEHLIAEYGSGMSLLHKLAPTLAEVRKARRLILNGKDYDTLLRKALERVHLQIEISATLAGGK